MKKTKLFGAIIFVLFLLNSCMGGGGDPTKDCVKYLMSQGHNYDEAWDLCEDAKYDSKIRH